MPAMVMMVAIVLSDAVVIHHLARHRHSVLKPAAVHRVVATDADSTATEHWQRIRQHESLDGRGSENIYQFTDDALMESIGMTKPPNYYSRAAQDQFALVAYALDARVWGRQQGVHAWQADFDICNL